MKWPSLDESDSLCICLLTVACNREMQAFFCCCWLFVVGGEKILVLGRVRALNLTVPLRSGQTISGTVGPGSGISLKPVQSQTSSTHAQRCQGNIGQSFPLPREFQTLI